LHRWVREPDHHDGPSGHQADERRAEEKELRGAAHRRRLDESHAGGIGARARA